MNNHHQLTIFDGDDTLWFVEPLYDEARTLAGKVVSGSGLSSERWELIERALDVKNVVTMGWSAERFPTSCVQAYEVLAVESGDEVNEHIIEDIRAAAETVFTRTAPLVDNAIEVLERVAAFGPIALLTKGDEEVQQRRIDQSGLSSYFDAVSIKPSKGAAEFSEILKTLMFEPERAWSVGNSIGSDIIPALRLGLRCVWIDAHVWEYEKANPAIIPKGILIASALSELPDLIENERFRAQH